MSNLRDAFTADELKVIDDYLATAPAVSQTPSGVDALATFIRKAREQAGPKPHTLTRGMLYEACYQLERITAALAERDREVAELRDALRKVQMKEGEHHRYGPLVAEGRER